MPEGAAPVLKCRGHCDGRPKFGSTTTIGRQTNSHPSSASLRGRRRGTSAGQKFSERKRGATFVFSDSGQVATVALQDQSMVAVQ